MKNTMKTNIMRIQETNTTMNMMNTILIFLFKSKCYLK